MAQPRKPRAEVPKPDGADIVIGKTLDLNARRAARASAEKKGPKVKVGLVTYELPGELRLETVRGVFALMNGDPAGMDRLFYDLFGKDAMDEPTEEELEALKPAPRAARLKAYNPAFKDLTMDDLSDIFELVDGHYGISLGNSPASTPS